MPGLHLYRSNRVESLAEHLGALLSHPLAQPLQAETIVVQSLGMRRWLSFQIAERHGIAMNCQFPFFVEFAQKVFQAAWPGEPLAGQAFSRDALLWRSLAALPGLLPDPEFAPLQRYLGNDEMTAVKSYQLARQIATVYDQYIGYTPERLLAWEEGQQEAWQSRLWQHLRAGTTEPHPAALLRRLQLAAETGSLTLPGLPERVSVFGIASLPPFYLRLLAQVCQAIEVHLFLFEPTEHFWGDVRSPAEQRRILRQHSGRHTAEELHLTAGNDLLASFGRAGRTFSTAVVDLEPVAWEEPFVAPEPKTLLHRVQREIFELEGEGDRPGGPLSLADGTIAIHCCHGPMREVEVLHDQLLSLFERYPDLTPKDVLVTMPNVETHAPFIEAVFGSPESDATRIPYTIADRSVQAQSSVARVFLRLLDLPGSRFTASDIFELLEARALRDRFGLAESDTEVIRRWVVRNHIRWGIDGEHRASFDLPPFEQNSWRHGLDRMLLGYAYPGDGQTLFHGLLPDSEIEGGSAELLGRLAEFASALFEESARLDTERTWTDWSRHLIHLLDTFFAATEEDAAEVIAVRRLLSGLARLAEFHPGPLPLPIVRHHLAGVLSETEGASGFLAGHVTFCSLRPMRSIPFRVICMLGLGDGEFPRRDTPIAFDLLAQEGSKVAGRSRRDEDRQLFLEALLSARDVFYLSYSGLSPKDNREAPPSVAVSELLDYLAGHQATAEQRAALITRHRLQPFSAAYFSGDPRLFSYSLANSRAIAGGTVSPGPCAGPPLPPATLDWHALELGQLASFFRSPAKFFLQQRLQVRLPGEEEMVEDGEPLALDSLAEWNLAKILTEGALAGRSADLLGTSVHATGAVPAGYFGRAQLHETGARVAPLVRSLTEATLGPPLPPQTLSVSRGDWTLQGTLGTLHEDGLLLFSAWELSGHDRLRAWLSHLLLNAAATPGLPRRTHLFGTDGTVVFEPRPDALARLADLVALLREGLTRPLPYFAKSSYDFARRTLQPRPREAPDRAQTPRRIYAADDAREAHIELCFRHLGEPCDDAWKALALRVWTPILQP